MLDLRCLGWKIHRPFRKVGGLSGLLEGLDQIFDSDYSLSLSARIVFK